MAERKNEAAWMEKQERWQIKVQKDGERKAFYSTTPGKKGKIEAEKKADKWLGSAPTTDRLKFGKAWEEWLAKQAKVNGEDNPTYKKNRSIGINYILPTLQYKKLSSIRLQDWQDIIDNAYTEKNLSKKTLENIRGAMTSFWRFCKKNRYACERPEELEIPRGASVGERKILQPSDLGVLLSEDTITHYGRQVPCHYIHYWRFAVFTGLRPGELIGLQNTDITGRVLSVRRSVNVDGVETRGKNNNARRTIVLTDYALAELEAQRQMLREMGIISPWVFPADDGTVSEEQHIYRRWQTYRRQHNITHASLYELRHTFVSINADVPDALLKQAVGHSKAMDTRGVYGHAVDGQQERTAKLIEAAFDEVLRPQK